VLEVETTLFNYLATRALRDAQVVSVNEAQADLTAATERQRLGVATVQEVLQTRTALSQQRYQLATAEGNLLAARGNLSSAMGLPANARFEVPAITADDSVADVLASVDTLINRSVTARPELAEARAEASALAAQVRVARSATLPALTLRASTGLTRSYSTVNTSTHPFSIGLGLSVPIFNGFAGIYDVRAAREQFEAGEARVTSLQQQISVQVFTAYFQLRAATERVRSATDLLTSAQQSATVALARYQEGLGTIVDVLLARSALATARAEAVQARWEWRMALAELAHDAGVLDLRGQPNLPLGGSSGGTR
jgi:outer membrane protein TolC